MAKIAQNQIFIEVFKRKARARLHGAGRDAGCSGTARTEPGERCRPWAVGVQPLGRARCGARAAPRGLASAAGAGTGTALLRASVGRQGLPGLTWGQRSRVRAKATC